MRGFWRLHARRFVDHPLRTVLTASGIVAAAALLVAVLCLTASITGSVTRAATVTGTADLQVSGLTSAGVDEGMLGEVEQVTGVEAAVPFVQASVTVSGSQAVLLGLDDRAAALADHDDPTTADLLAAASSDGPVPGGIVISSALADRVGVNVGAEVQISTDGSEADAPVLAVVDEGMLPGGAAAVVAQLDYAATLTGRPDRLDGIALVAEAGTDIDGLEKRILDTVDGRAAVGSPHQLAEQAAASAEVLRTGLLLVAIIALLVAAFVVFNTVSMAALERRRELATLRALGARRRPLLVGFVASAGVLGMAAASVGAVLGIGIARHLVAGIAAQVVGSFGFRVSFVLPWYSIPLTIVVGGGVAAAAAFLPGRAAVDVAPVVAMRPEGLLETGTGDRTVWPAAVSGLAAAVTGLILAFAVGRRAAVVSVALFWGGSTVALFSFAAPLARSAARLTAHLEVAGQLASVELRGAPRRAVATAAAVAAAVALAVAQSGTERNVDTALESAYGQLAATELVVAGSGSSAANAFTGGPLLPQSLAADIAALPDVAAAGSGHDTFMTLGSDRVRLRGVEQHSAQPAWQLAAGSVREEVQAGEAVILTSRLASDRGLEAGDWLTLPTSSGEHRLRVGAVVDTFGWAQGDVILSLDRLHDWFGLSGLTRVEVSLADGGQVSALREQIESLIDRSGASARLLTGAEAVEEASGPVRQVAATFDALRLIIIATAGLALFNTMTIAVVQRRRELGLLRAVGTSRRRLRNSVLAEGMALGALGVVVGLLLGVGGHYLVVLGTQQAAGIPVVFRFEPLVLGIAAVFALLVTVAGCLGPAWRAGRLDVLEAVGYE